MLIIKQPMPTKAVARAPNNRLVTRSKNNGDVFLSTFVQISIRIVPSIDYNRDILDRVGRSFLSRRAIGFRSRDRPSVCPWHSPDGTPATSGNTPPYRPR